MKKKPMLVHNFLQKSAENLPDKEALICNGTRLTFLEIETFSNCLANALKAAGLQKFDRVAIYLENSIEAVISIFGISKAGGIFTIINPQTKARRVSPKEIENILYKLKGVSEAAVYGVEDEILGQAIKVSLVLEVGSNLTEKDIFEYCGKNLEKFMVPKHIEILEYLPKTINSKINKKALKQFK